MKKNLPVSVCAVLVSLFMGLSCSTSYKGYDDCHNTIVLKNATDKAIYYASTLKDGLLNYDPTNKDYAVDYKVLPGESKKVKIGITLSCWEHVMKSASGYVAISIYDAATLETSGWAENRNKPLKKYILDVKQLNKMNWSVTYP